MKHKTIYILVAILLSAIPMAMADDSISTNIPDGYVPLSDIGNYGTIIPNAEDILIPKAIADSISSQVAPPNIKKIKDANNLDKKSNKRIIVKIPTSPPSSGDDSGDYSILSSANVIFSANVTKLWNKTYTGDILIAWNIEDLTGDKKDEALVLVYYPTLTKYTLYIIRGTNGQVLWSYPAASGQTLMWDFVKDVDLDGNTDILLTVDKPQTFGSDFIVYMKKGNTGATLWSDTTLKATSLLAEVFGDLNGDKISDVILTKGKLDLMTFKSSFEVIAKKGNNGAKLWAESASVSGTIFGFVMPAPDLNGDSFPEVILEKFTSNGLTGMFTFEAKAKKGQNGLNLWSDIKNIKGSIFGIAYPLFDLNKDGLPDVILDRFGTNTTSKISFHEVKAKRGNTGTQLWLDTQTVTNGKVTTRFVPVGEVTGDGIEDIFLDKIKCSANPCASGNVYRTIKTIRGHDGSNVWAQSATFPTGWQYGYSFPIGDMNKDGKPDIFVQEYRKNPSSATDYLLISSIIQAKNGVKLWGPETIHGLLSQQSVMPSFAIFDLNGDTYKDLLMEYINKGNITIRVRKGPNGLELWKALFTKTTSSETIDVFPMYTQDVNGDSFFDVFFDIRRSKPGSQSETIQERIGSNGVIKWQDSVSGLQAFADWDILGDVNADRVSDLLLNGYSRTTLTKTYLYKVKNMKTGGNFWSESKTTGASLTYGQMQACDAGDLKGNNKVNILRYTHSAPGAYDITAKIAPIGSQLWQIKSNKDINACGNVYSNFNGDLKDDNLIKTYRDIYAITTK